MIVLVPNLGSTSLKYQILDMPSGKPLRSGRFERVSDHAEAIAGIPQPDAPVEVVAFKAVHGGPRYRGTYVVDDGLLAAMEEYLPAAPAHNRIYLSAIKAFRAAMPSTLLVAAFETEFHATMPEHAARYGVPSQWEAEGVRRYGFHGASHEYVSGRAAELLGRSKDEVALVSCHLGGSSSICAIQNGRSVDTTMGFSPQSGLENATRHGDLDAFCILFMMERHGWTPAQVSEQLARQGGLSGISEIEGGDVRDLEAAAAQGNAKAALALEVFAYEVRKTIGAYAAAMGGLDAIAFTGGIGENSAPLRSRCCAGLEFLGVMLDRERNEKSKGDRIVSADASRVAVLALATNEELVVARRAYKLLTAEGSRTGAMSALSP
jgi:acetate kinase